MFAELLLGTLFPWLVAIFLALLVILSALLIPTFVQNLAKSPKKFLVLGLITLIGATYLRFGIVPNQHRIFYDEDRYLGYSVSFARLNKAVSLEVASLHQSVVGKPDQAVRVTIPVLHGLVLKLFGYHEAYLFNTSRIISTLLALFLAILGFQLFRSYAGAFVTFVFALFLPIVVYWSASMALDPYFVFFTVLSFVYLHFYLRRPSHYRGILASVAIFLLLCVRIESFILLPLVVWFTIAFRRNESQPLIQRHDIVFLALLVPLICIRGFASISVIGAKWCCADSLPLEAFSIKYVTRNLLPNIMYVITGYEVPFVITIPALWIAFTSRHYSHRFLLYWIGAFFVLYSCYYAGLFVTPEYSGSYARYYLIIIPPLLLLYGNFIATNLPTMAKKSRKYLAVTIVLVGLSITVLLNNFWHYRDLVVYMPTIFNPVDQGPVYVHAYLDHVLLPKIPKGSVVIHPITSIPYLNGHPTVYYQFFLENDTAIQFVKDQLRHGNRVFTMNAFDCRAIPHKCDKIERSFTARYSKLNTPATSNIFQIYELFLKKK